jgi:release factor glutamine methyltransferase
MTATLGERIERARRRLAAAPFRPPAREAWLLMGRVLGLSEAQVLAREDRPLAAEEAARFEALLARRLRGEPVAYLVGEKEFYGRPFAVDRRVLIPRPETEHLVEAALAVALPPAPRLLDVGTGSGCLAVTLALEIAGARVVATDRSPGALGVAAGNARRHRVGDRVALVAADLFAGLDPGRFDLVVANPPYVDRGEAAELSPEVVEFEPEGALFPPGRGEALVVDLIEGAARLAPGATLLVEIGRGQLAAARHAAARSGLAVAAVVDDYAGVPRVVRLERR